MSKLSKVKVELQKLLLQFGSQATDKGTLEYTGESLEVGMEVFIEDEPAPDGDYALEDGRLVVVAEGKVAEIKDAPAEEPEPEPAPVEQEEQVPPVEETPAPEEKNILEIVEPLVAKVAELEEKIATVMERMSEIETKLQDPNGKPIDEQFEELSSVKPTLFRK